MEPLDIPKEIKDDYKGINTVKLDIIKGYYPNDRQKELLIPDFLEGYIKEKYNLNNVLDSEIELNVTKSQENKNDKVIKSKYKIVGIYKTDYQKKVDKEYKIYVGNSDQTPQELQNWVDSFTQEDLKNSKDSELPQNLEYNKDMYKDLDSYKKGQGLLYGMYIKLDDSSYNESVSKELDKLYPNYVQKSRYTFNQSYKDSIHEYYLNVFKICFIYGIIIAFIMILVTRLYYGSKYKTYGILRVNKYKRKEIVKSILIELLIDLVISLILFGTIIFILSFSYAPAIVTYISDFSSRIIYIAIISYILIVDILIFIINMLKTRDKNIKNLLK